MTDFSAKARGLLAQVQQQQEGLAPEISQVHTDAERLLEMARKVGNSWSGSNLGYHGELFFGDFEQPTIGQRFSVEWGGIHGLPPGWKTRTPDEVRQRIDDLSGIRPEEIKSASQHLLDEAKTLQTELLIELSPLHNANGFNKEKELLNGLENFDWREKAHNEYAAKAINSFPHATRDREAIMQGRILPAHTYYEAVAFQVLAHSEAIQRFWRSADRLLRQIQAQMPDIPVLAAVSVETSKAEERYVREDRTKTVFLIHGRAEAAQQTVARFLEKLGLHVIILSEQPSQGRTIIEKFEHHADVGYAVALLTPDDTGGLEADPIKLEPRARQNVILEMGYFIGKLGRSNVCALNVDGVELPSDLHGIVYISLDPGEGWKLKLISELKAAGMQVDLGDAVR